MAQAAAALDSCDLFLTVGTSSVVYPAAGFAGQVSLMWCHTSSIIWLRYLLLKPW